MVPLYSFMNAQYRWKYMVESVSSTTLLRSLFRLLQAIFFEIYANLHNNSQLIMIDAKVFMSFYYVPMIQILKIILRHQKMYSHSLSNVLKHTVKHSFRGKDPTGFGLIQTFVFLSRKKHTPKLTATRASSSRPSYHCCLC